MSKKKETVDLLKQQGFVPLFYHDDPEVCVEVTKALYAAGARFLEFTNRGEHAFKNFKQMLKSRDKEMPGLVLAIGTIKNTRDAKRFMIAGADCIISPGMVAGMGKAVDGAGLLWIPGCMTATEIMQAEECGAVIVKLFPGHLLGPGFMSAIREIFPAVDFMPTGGVEMNRDNLEAWFNAGVCAVGMGSKLVSKELLSNRKYSEITRRAKEMMGIIRDVRPLSHNEKK
jgi:2-dehydro-3-deoxyphosphogluconate aldolase / (4S)-4-hydroxy-2-oxoglutarate aldolase